MSRITLYGCLVYQDDLLDTYVLPELINREALNRNIIVKLGQLYPYHQHPAMLKLSIELWFSRKYYNFEKMVEALQSEFNPVENYNRYSEHEQINSGRSVTDDSNVRQNRGDDENERLVSAFDSSTYQKSEKSITTYNSDTVDTGNSSTTTDNNENYHDHIHGNIGVTTAHDLIRGAIELYHTYDIVEIITKMFEKEFIVQVY